MSSLAEMTHECEVCGAGLRYRGGPYAPRWCGEHRGEAERERHNELERKRRGTMAGDPNIRCADCDTRLLRPSPDDLCVFCRFERL